jgi:cysteine synthase
MFGWEFPPHISGGLGTACYGLTKGLAKLNQVGVIFVVPKAFGDEEQSAIQIIGANNISISRKEIQFKDVQQKIDYFEVESKSDSLCWRRGILDIEKPQIFERNTFCSNRRWI